MSWFLLYLQHHELIEAAVHHQTQRAGRGVPAQALSAVGRSPLSRLIRRSVQPALLFPLLSFFPATQF